MSKRLIALVATAVLLDGIRTIIQPGQELPDLDDNDADALLRTGMAQDPAATAALDKNDAKAQEQTEREFQQARDRVLSAEASTEPEPAPATPAKKAKADAK